MGKIVMLTDNGEVAKVWEGGEAYIRTRSQDEYYKKMHQRGCLKDERRFIACFNDEIKEVTKQLNNRECGALLKLVLCMRLGEEGVLRKNKKPMTKGDMRYVLGVSDRTATKIINRLMELDIIQAEKTKSKTVYKVNSKYHTMGKEIEKGKIFTKLFLTATRDIVELLTIEEIGMFYRMIPHFHYQRYYLVHNPNEPYVEGAEMKFMSIVELAGISDLSVPRTRRLIAKLTDIGVLLTIKGCGFTSCVINPELISRETVESDWTANLKLMFEDMKGAKNKVIYM